jgi:hypothetical protein
MVGEKYLLCTPHWRDAPAPLRTMLNQHGITIRGGATELIRDWLADKNRVPSTPPVRPFNEPKEEDA